MLNDNGYRDTDNTTNGAGDDVRATLASLRERAQALIQDAEQLEVKIGIARGTGDVTREAGQALAIVTPKKPSLANQISALVLEHSLSLDEISKEIGEPTGKLQPILKEMRRQKQIYNVGRSDRPRWTLVIGDNTSNELLYPLVERLLREQPMTTAELVDATGARESRVSGAVVHLQRTRTGMLNLGRANHGRWFIVPEGAKIAKLEPKKR